MYSFCNVSKQQRIEAEVAAVRVFAFVHNFCSKYNHILWKVIFVVQLGVLGLITLQLSTVLYGGGSTYSEFSNGYCLDNAVPNIQSTTLNGTQTAACAYDYNFKKVLYFWCDGISYDMATPIFDVFPNNQNLFKVRHRENPWSAWVFATYMTGKGDRIMGTVRNDNLIYQFAQAGLKSYIGAKQSTAYVFGQLDTKFAKGTDDVLYNMNGNTEDDEGRMFHWLFECSQFSDSAKCVNATLSKAKAENRSFFFESFILDHRVHETNSKHNPEAVALGAQLAQDIALVKKWVDANPDYLLVLVSDHGQKNSNDEVEIHGKWLVEGNEGWVLLYNPVFGNTISSASNPLVLNTVDVAPTLWQYFSASGVSIPAESIGKVYPVATSANTRYKALYTNALQLHAFLDHEGHASVDMGDFDAAEEHYSQGLYEQAVLDMETHLASVSDTLLAEGGKLPLKLPFFSTLIALVVTLVIQFGSRSVLWTAGRAAGYGVLSSPYMIWIVTTLFFTQASDFEPRNQVYAYSIPLLAFLAYYTFKRMAKVPAIPEEKKGHKLVKFELMDSNSTSSSSSDDLDSNPDDSEDAEIDVPSLSPQAQQYLYFELWDHAIQKKFRELAVSIVGYITGARVTAKSSVGYWLMHVIVTFAVFACFEIAFIHKRFIWGDIEGLDSSIVFWRSLAMAVMFLEFRWQRTLLTSNLYLNSGKTATLLQQITHPSFWPLNIKMIGYFYMLALLCSPAPSDLTFHAIYGITLTHIVILLFSSTHLQRDLFLPLFILSFAISFPQERILLCMYVTILHFLSNAFEKQSHANRYVLPTVLVAMLSLGHYYFSVLFKTPYVLDQMNLSVPGIRDITKYPDFSLVIIGIHYLGVFFMLIPFIVRLVAPAPPPLRPFKIGCITFGHEPIPRPAGDPESFVKHYRRFTMSFMMFCSCLSVFLYYIFSMDERSDIPLIWAFMSCAVAIGYGVTVLATELADAVVRLARFLKKSIAKWWKKVYNTDTRFMRFLPSQTDCNINKV